LRKVIAQAQFFSRPLWCALVGAPQTNLPLIGIIDSAQLSGRGHPI